MRRNGTIARKPNQASCKSYRVKTPAKLPRGKQGIDSYMPNPKFAPLANHSYQ